MKFTIMKCSFALLLGFMALGLTGCLVTSVAPFYTPKDIVFNSELLGNWVDSSNQNERWEFEANGTNAYSVAYVSDGKAYSMQGCFFRLRGQGFLDLTTTEMKEDIQPPPIPSHYLLRVVTIKPNLKLAPLDYDWLKSYLTRHPKALAHQVIQNGTKADDVRFVLTADTAKLQSFLGRHLETKEAWSQVNELKPAPRATAIPSN